jgi:hypothetical protein
MIKFKALSFVECRVGKWLVMQEALKRPALPPGIALVPRHKSSELQFELLSRWLSKDAVALACWRLGPADRGRQLARKEVPKSMCGAVSSSLLVLLQTAYRSLSTWTLETTESKSKKKKTIER